MNVQQFNQDIIDVFQKHGIYEGIVIWEEEKLLAVSRLAAEDFKTKRFDSLLDVINYIVQETARGSAI